MAKGGRWSDGEGGEVRDMRDAETTLAILRERKTLMVCYECHTAIHAGRPTRTKADDGTGIF